jgi:hypothetical protein
MTQLFLDCDGVLADFDKKAVEIFGMHPREFENKHGQGAFWREINHYNTNQNGFFSALEMMEDAHHLYEAVKHLHPIILTGVPGNDWAAPQKVKWVERMFGPNQRVICCQSKKKCTFASPGDVLVDDWDKYRALWEAVPAIFVHHKSAATSIEALKEIGIL